MKHELSSKTKCIICCVFTLAVCLLPIHPFWLGDVLACVGGFMTGHYFINAYLEKH